MNGNKPARSYDTTAAFNVESARAQMLARVVIPHDFVNKAIRKVYNKLDAKETKFFTFRGEVIDKVDVEDNAAQLNAADKILSVAGLYAREREQQQTTPIVALEVDPATGIIRMVVGGGDYHVNNGTKINAGMDDSRRELASGDEQLPLFDSPLEHIDDVVDAEPPVQVVKVKPGRLPDHIHQILFGKDG
jgi:hypothetical protein